MQCPYCGSEMAAGYIQSRDGVYWSEKRRPVAALPVLSGERIALVGEDSGAFSVKAARAYCCKACRKVILECS